MLTNLVSDRYQLWPYKIIEWTKKNELSEEKKIEDNVKNCENWREARVENELLLEILAHWNPRIEIGALKSAHWNGFRNR